MAVATANMRSVLASADGRRAVADAIANQATHFDMLGLQLGYSYGHDDATDCPHAIDPVREYVPVSRVGARLPHGWVGHGGTRVSTLDLVPLDSSIVLLGREADESLTPAGVRKLRLGVDVGDPDDWWTGVMGLEPSGAVLVRPDQHIAARWKGTTQVSGGRSGRSI